MPGCGPKLLGGPARRRMALRRLWGHLRTLIRIRGLSVPSLDRFSADSPELAAEVARRIGLRDRKVFAQMTFRRGVPGRFGELLRLTSTV